MNNNYTMKNLIDEMEKGKKSTQILRKLLLQRRPRVSKKLDIQIDSGDDYVKELEHHSMVALTSCVTSLSLIRGFDMQTGLTNLRKRKLEHDHDHDHGESQMLRGEIKHEHLYGDEVSNTPTINHTKNKRGCYKRRKSGEGRVEEVTQLRDDGFAWRKYGQKVILKTSHPRNYFRCTHKFDKKCPATKQVQQISDNPTKYRIIYHGNHICNYNNHLNQSTVTIDNDEHSSAIVLNFDQSSQINPLLFPTSAMSANNNTTMKQEYNSPTSDQSTSPAQTAVTGPSWTTLVSEQSDLISTADNCSSTSATECDVDEDDYFSSMWTDLEELNGVFAF